MIKFNSPASLIALFAGLCFSLVVSAQGFQKNPNPGIIKQDSAKRRHELEKLLTQLPPDLAKNGPVSFYDKTFTDWLNRTGELPPDFEAMPSIPFLPDPLIQEINGTYSPIKTAEDWQKKRILLRKQIQYYLTGDFPEQPHNLTATTLSERKDGEVLLQTVVLKFGPKADAKLTVEMIIPPGKGPFPVFITQWNHREWAQIAVKRGYAACVLATADIQDDTEEYSRIWAGKHDFTRLMRRAFGTFVAVDYLYTLLHVDKKKIGIAGHSRNGKLSMLAGAFDERITAVISSSGGSGAEIPWRYTTPKYVVEDIALLTSAQPAWFHPRLRFFVNHENKLPVDQNAYMALIAPRGLMISTSATESASNPWGAEQAFKSAQGVYRYLGAEDNLAIRFRNGYHGTSARDIEDYLDFFDYVFKRGGPKPENKLLYNYDFEDWKRISKEDINPLNWPVIGLDSILSMEAGRSIKSVGDWDSKRQALLKQIRWIMGEQPGLVTNLGPRSMQKGGEGEDNFGSFLPRPAETAQMGVMKVTPYHGFGDYLYGNLYYPKGKVKPGVSAKFPLIIYLHPYDYSKGFSTTDHQYSIQPFFENLIKQGYSVFAFDMLGFGNRAEEGTKFYQRHPHWSKMGQMVADVKSAVDAMENLGMIDKHKIYTVGYALGGTVGLYAAALDTRIAGSVVISGFTPMKSTGTGEKIEGISGFSHLHGLLPRLGFFVGNEDRIPFDFHELVACIAPRPVRVIAPQEDWNANLPGIQKVVNESGKIYNLYNARPNLELFSPSPVEGFSEQIWEIIYQWNKNR